VQQSYASDYERSLGHVASRSPATAWWALVLAAWAALSAGCRLVGEKPSNFRDWSPDMAVLPYAEVDGSRVHIRNIRNCQYYDADTYVLDSYDKTYDLNRLQTVDFITVPFRDMPSLAHTMLSFGFEGDEYLAVSVEIRREKGEQYQFLAGILDQYELMYVLGDERDLVNLRANYRKDDVYVYRTKATPQQARRLFLDVMQRVDKLAEQPEFYNTLTNNCTTNIRGHINSLAPGKVPYGLSVLLPGLSDRFAYDLGLLDTKASYEETHRQARINDVARQYRDSPEFSAAIRR
jgi:hypothetical protein